MANGDTVSMAMEVIKSEKVMWIRAGKEDRDEDDGEADREARLRCIMGSNAADLKLIPHQNPWAAA